MHPTQQDLRPPELLAERRASAIELGVLQGAYLLYLLPWFFLAIGGTMGLGNWNSLLAAPVIFAWWIYPVVALGTTVAAWVLFGTRRHVAARRVNRVPLLWVLVGVALIGWIVVAG